MTQSTFNRILEQIEIADQAAINFSRAKELFAQGMISIEEMRVTAEAFRDVAELAGA